uniref:26S proteasome non-ATPase regulatory subunit 8 n=1 Tax=Arundo donax TaxID=35708 RepID=A0A0A9EQQ7_ARUDO
METQNPKARGKLPRPSMDSELEEVTRKLAWLNFECARDDVDSCVALLSELKALLTKFPSLPPSFEKTTNAVTEMKIARAVYEHAVVLSMKIKDQDAFERNLCQLKAFYIDTCGMIPPSPDEYPFLGLNLLWLLAENKIAEFHTDLELLPLEALDHPCIRYVLKLEQSFMEGTYNRLFNARQAVPHETYVYFMDHLTETVR